MKISIKNLSQSRREIYISFPFKELEKEIELAAKKLGEKIKIDGFREGKVPPEIIQEKIGKDVVLEEAINIKIQEIYKRVIQDNDLEVIGSPKV
ncbi:trigger factor family protein, partial [bacterium]|nr:trigger factor family protein [bacterium]